MKSKLSAHTAKWRELCVWFFIIIVSIVWKHAFSWGSLGFRISLFLIRSQKPEVACIYIPLLTRLDTQLLTAFFSCRRRRSQAAFFCWWLPRTADRETPHPTYRCLWSSRQWDLTEARWMSRDSARRAGAWSSGGFERELWWDDVPLIWPHRQLSCVRDFGGRCAASERWMNELKGFVEEFTAWTAEFNMCRMSYGVVVNWGFSKMAELRCSGLLLSGMLFPGWNKAIWTLSFKTSRVYSWCVFACVCACSCVHCVCKGVIDGLTFVFPVYVCMYVFWFF